VTAPWNMPPPRGEGFGIPNRSPDPLVRRAGRDHPFPISAGSPWREGTSHVGWEKEIDPHTGQDTGTCCCVLLPHRTILDVIRNLDFVKISSTFIDLQDDTILSWPRLEIGPCPRGLGKTGLAASPHRAHRWLMNLSYTCAMLASASQHSQRRES
jgi:hypothetical protein